MTLLGFIEAPARGIVHRIKRETVFAVSFGIPIIRLSDNVKVHQSRVDSRQGVGGYQKRVLGITYNTFLPLNQDIADFVALKIPNWEVLHCLADRLVVLNKPGVGREVFDWNFRPVYEHNSNCGVLSFQ